MPHNKVNNPAASNGVCDPRGIRQMDAGASAWLIARRNQSPARSVKRGSPVIAFTYSASDGAPVLSKPHFHYPAKIQPQPVTSAKSADTSSRSSAGAFSRSFIWTTLLSGR